MLGRQDSQSSKRRSSPMKTKRTYQASRVQQREWMSCGLQVGEGLGDVDFGEAIDGLELHNQAALDEEVHSPLADLVPFVLDPKSHLVLEGNSAEAKLDGKRLLVDGLHVARPKVPVHFDGRLNHA